MTRVWEENKPLILVMGVCLLMLAVIRPNVFSMGPPLGRWLGANWKEQYDELDTKKRDLEQKHKEFAPGLGTEKIADIEAGLEISNRVLKERFDGRVHSLVFVPYRPFLPPMDQEEPGHYFMTQLTRTRDDRVLPYCSARFVKVVPGLGFERFQKGVPPPPKEVPNLLRQLAVAETFVKLCADNQIDFVHIVKYLPQRVRGTEGKKGRKKFILEHPMEVRLKADFHNFLKLLSALNGLQGRVTYVKRNEWEEVEGVRLDIGSDHGVRNGRQFTIFKRSPEKPCLLKYAARVTVTSVWEKQSFAAIDEGSLPYARLDAESFKAARRVRAGDYATTGFFHVLRLDLGAVPGKVEARNAQGVPTKVRPHMVDVSLQVSTIGFNPATAYLTAANVEKLTGRQVKKKAAAKARPRHVVTRPGW